jgi:hypothetical protein
MALMSTDKYNTLLFECLDCRFTEVVVDFSTRPLQIGISLSVLISVISGCDLYSYFSCQFLHKWVDWF